jgi:hypothetical protein
MSALFSRASHSINWRIVAMVTLAFWLSSTLLIDLVVMPGLYAAGMMREATFATAGYSLFWIFNRLELLCAAVLLTGVLVLFYSSQRFEEQRRMVAIASFLFLIPVLYTYLFTPAMTQLGMTLDWFALPTAVPDQMNQIHGAYFGLEVLKLALGGWLLRHLYGDRLMLLQEWSHDWD